MKIAVRIILPILILFLAWKIMGYFIESKPEPAQRPEAPVFTRVEATTLKTTSYPVIIRTYGTVQPRTTTTLIPEVSGTIIEVSPSLREGGFFEKDEILLRIDPLDYETLLVSAQLQVAQAESAIAQEAARSEQARENWDRLGKSGTPGPLVLREPQMAEAEAQLASAQADLVKAQRDLDRTAIRAPYAGRILSQEVDVGQYVSPGTVLAEVFAIDYVEARLPLSNDQLAFVNLPENFRNAPEDDPQSFPSVLLKGKIGGRQATWPGRIVRVAGALDEASRQLFAVAQVDDPYVKRDDGTPELKLGLFVEAEVQGVTLEGVFVIPRSAVRATGDVIIIDEESTMRRRRIVPIWKGEHNVVVREDPEDGLTTGEILCITPLAYPVEGAPVLATIDGVPPQEPSGRRENGKPTAAKPADGVTQRGDGTPVAPGKDA